MRGSRYEVRGPRFEVRGPRSEVRGPRSEVRGPKFEVRGSRSEVRGPRCEVRGPRCEVRGPRCEVRGTRYEVRGPRCEVRGPRCEVRGCTEPTLPLPSSISNTYSILQYVFATAKLDSLQTSILFLFLATVLCCLPSRATSIIRNRNSKAVGTPSGELPVFNQFAAFQQCQFSSTFKPFSPIRCSSSIWIVAACPLWDTGHVRDEDGVTTGWLHMGLSIAQMHAHM